jgi:hypothetical protein
MTVKELLELQKRFGTDAAIGKHLGITRQSVFQWRRKLGIASIKRQKIERDNSIIQLHLAHVNVRKIASLHHISIAQAYRILNKYGRIARKE